MPTDWTELPLGDLITHKKGFAFKSVDFLRDGGRRVIRVSDTDANSIKTEDPIFLPESKAVEFSDYALQPGDIILTTVGSRPPLYDSMVGKTIRVPHNAAGSLLNQNMVRLSPRTELIDSGFLYSVLKTRKFIFHIEGSARGNANQASITLDDTFEFPVPVPPLPEQRKIAEILSCWDKSIETVCKIISKLEKLRLEYLRLFSRGEQKVVTRQLGEVLELVYGKSPKDILNPDGRYPVVGTGGIVGRTDQALSNNASVIVGRKGTINKPLLIESPFWAIDTTYYVQPKESVDLYWLLVLFQSMNLASYNESSGVPSLLRETLYSISIPVPTHEDQIRIGTFFRALDEEILMQNKLMKCFSSQKQALMQKLLTGKIRVKV